MTVSFSGIGRGTPGLDLRTILNLLSAKRIVSPALIEVEIGASQDDWNPAGLDDALVISVTQDGGPFSITGLAGGGAKVSHVIVNDDISENLTLVHESTDSEAAHRLNNGGSNLVLAPGEAAALDYNTASSRYVVVTTAVPFPLANAPGEQGAPGLDGTDPGYPFVFKSAVTEDDPDLGNVQFNNATFSSVTKIIISDFASSNDNPDVSAIIASWDDVGDSDRGRLLLKSRSNPERTAYLKIAGAITDHGGDWAEIPVAPIGANTLNADDAVSVQYYQPGPEGEITGGVTTFNGRDGTVVPEAGDYSAADIDYDNSTSGLAADTVQAAVDEVEDRVDTLEGQIDGLAASEVDNDSSVSGATVKDALDSLEDEIDSVTQDQIHAATGKTAPADADEFGLIDSAASNVLKKLTWANVKATLKTYFDGLYQAQGKHTIWVPAAAMTPRTTNGAAANKVESTTNKNMIRSLDFDSTTQEFAQFEVAMPKDWNAGTVTFQPIWSHAATTTNFGVVWALQAVATSDDDAMDAAFGTEQTSTDTGGTTNDRYIGPESSAITIAGTPATGDVVQFQVKRNPSDGSDTMAIDARLHGVKLYYTTNAANDA